MSWQFPFYRDVLAVLIFIGMSWQFPVNFLFVYFPLSISSFISSGLR